MGKNPIYVTGYPKSGTTWLTRLLGDALDCPTGGCTSKYDSKEIASEGRSRQSEYVVRKGHFVLVGPEDYQSGHFLTEEMVQRNPTVHIIRDPRDIAVSAGYHWGKCSLSAIMQNMSLGKGCFRHCGQWDEYVERWLPLCPTVRYENLLKDGLSELTRVILELGFEPPEPRKLEIVIARQAFDKRVEHIQEYGEMYPLGKEFNLKFMRKGISGDWRNHFDKWLAYRFWFRFGSKIRELGYEEDDEWYKEI